MRLVYYSLANAPESVREEQWIQSIRSLRRHNRDVAVWLVLFNGASGGLLREAARWGVTVCDRGTYRGYLERLSCHSSSLAAHPTLHKFFSLAGMPVRAVSQILYVDCDTFFFDDVERLFEHCQSDWYAREEPFSRLSPYGYDPNYLNEDLLADIVQRESLRPVVPFNSGVCVLNNGVWTEFERLSRAYLEYVRRLDPDAPGHDPRTALPYPSSNRWIIDQVALWLTLGRLAQLSQSLLSPDEVVQGTEFNAALSAVSPSVVAAHYYSLAACQFFSVVPPILD